MSIEWKGSQAVYIVGTQHEDNTLRVQPNQQIKEKTLTLILPTLCVTYADMKFANSIGGPQKNYPDSKVYGPKFFDPPIVITGYKNVEKFTYIRGADRVTIGKDKTSIECPGWSELVIPKLRIEAKRRVKVLLRIPPIMISVNQPFNVRLRQYADGRHIGGVEVIKRHPDWKPSEEPKEYDLWIRVIDGSSRRAIPKARITIYTWSGIGDKGFVPEASWFTNRNGIAEASGLPCSDKKLVLVESQPLLPRTWRFRPLPGQDVRQTFKLWKNKEAPIPTEPLTEKPIIIAALEPVYHAEARDTLEKIAEYFCFENRKELAQANNLTEKHRVYPDQELFLPGWQFLQAESADLFAEFDQKYGLPHGWSRPAQRTLHDDPAKSYEHEIVAVPTLDFAKKHELRTLY